MSKGRDFGYGNHDLTGNLGETLALQNKNRKCVVCYYCYYGCYHHHKIPLLVTPVSHAGVRTSSAPCEARCCEDGLSAAQHELHMGSSLNWGPF